jgi:hypothetical protein
LFSRKRIALGISYGERPILSLVDVSNDDGNLGD